jgi:CO/xanthine dehydrogenase FAD-binding subunit
MLWLRLGSGNVNTAIDMSNLGLDTIEETEEQFAIGAMVTLRDLEKHENLNSYCNNAVSNAVKDIVGVQFRNMATVGGSIWGRFGFSDVLTVFLAMDTYVELYKGGIVPLEQFATAKPDNDILVRLIVKKTPCKVVYTAMRNQRTDFPVLTCAVSDINGEYRASIGARPARAKCWRDEKEILTDGITADSAKAFAMFVAENAPTEGNVRGSAAYRTHLIRVLTERSVKELGGI